MPNDFKKEFFKTNVLIKNIIGKELINDDNVAVMELVKNSYDAGASKVTIEFKNLFSESKISELIIQDDGVGMSGEDIITKWLNIAYSSKKLEHTQNNRYQAGNKGVGRFSCDRLGEKLNIYTRQSDEKIIHLKIDWKDFELLDEIDIQIQDIAVYTREIEDSEFKKETGFTSFTHGTILQIQKLNNHWIKIESKNNLFTDFDIDNTRLLKLKSSLERLINPNQSYSKNSFNIHIKVNELEEDKELPYHEKVIGVIKNQIFDKLDFKTTFIESSISEDGSQIITELKDKNKTIFRVIEKNKDFPLLKDIKITIYYLNPYAKGFFTKKTGIQSVAFGSIFLFINGFRIPPYGDRENDAFGLEVRKNQGQARYFGNREILGRIEIKDFDNKFRVISSREGIVHNDYYKQLIRDNEKKRGKYNGYFYTTLKRIEKYVVDGLKWDSLPEELNELTIQKEIVDGIWDSSKEIYKIDNRKKLTNSSDVIKQMLAIKSQDVLDLYINDDLIENLIEEDTEKTQKKLQDFIKNFGSLANSVLDEETQKSLEKLTGNIQDEELMLLYKDVLSQKDKVEEDLEEEKKSKDELYKIFRKKTREQKKKARDEKKKLEKELSVVKAEKNQFQHLNTLDKQQILDLHHSIGIASKTINNYLSNIKLRLEKNNPRRPVDKEYLEDIIKKISFVNHKISSIANFATKANFKADSEDMVNDLVVFIAKYIDIVCMGEMKTLNHELLDISLQNKFDGKFILCFKPIEIAMLIDNLISNARKANATKVDIYLKNNDKDFELIIIDNGYGVEEEVKDRIFKSGVTTTDGSGMGLSHVVRILDSLNGTIKLDEKNLAGTKFIVGIKNEIKI